MSAVRRHFSQLTVLPVAVASSCPTIMTSGTDELLESVCHNNNNINEQDNLCAAVIVLRTLREFTGFKQ